MRSTRPSESVDLGTDAVPHGDVGEGELLAQLAGERGRLVLAGLHGSPGQLPPSGGGGGPGPAGREHPAVADEGGSHDDAHAGQSHRRSPRMRSWLNS